MKPLDKERGEKAETKADEKPVEAAPVVEDECYISHDSVFVYSFS